MLQPACTPAKKPKKWQLQTARAAAPQASELAESLLWEPPVKQTNNQTTTHQYCLRHTQLTLPKAGTNEGAQHSNDTDTDTRAVQEQ